MRIMGAPRIPMSSLFMAPSLLFLAFFIIIFEFVFNFKQNFNVDFVL